MRGGAEATFQEFLWKMGLKWETPKNPTQSTLIATKPQTRQGTPNSKLNKTVSLFPYVFSNSTKSIRTRSTVKSLCLKEIIKKQTKLLITAQSWGLYKLDNQQIVRGFKVHQPLQIANLSKIAIFYTALLLIKRYTLDVRTFEVCCIGISEHDRSSLIEGELLTLEDLLHYMMMTNGTESSYALAVNLGLLLEFKIKGQKYNISIFEQRKDWNQFSKKFLELCCEVIADLRLDSTIIVSTRHLQMNKSSVKDLAMLTSQCLKYPFFSEVVGTVEREIHTRFRNSEYKWERRSFQIRNSNQTMSNPYFQGVKVAYNLKFGGSIVSLYKSPNLQVLIVVLGSSGKNAKYDDTDKILEWYRRSKLQ